MVSGSHAPTVLDTIAPGRRGRLPPDRLAPVRILPGDDVADEEWPLLAGAMSHELHAALALISGYSQSLLHLPLDDDTRRRYLERILSATDSLTEFADRVLEVAGPPGGQPVLRRRPVALEWMVDRLVRQLSAEQESAPVCLQLPRNLPLVDVDPAWITHVLRNLVRNALTHGRSGAGDAVTISARHVGDEVVVTIADGGTGFDPDEREVAFHAVRPGRRVRASERAGLGFGLYLCRELVEAHGGRIWLDQVAKGAAVSFTLPTCRATAVGIEGDALEVAGRASF